ncbi:MAG: HAMP domain-containing protein [Candidatus Riflebacteria bacterium]|nr:HAMP domain-containing protein [Candidatus Riflebacteria bacterium]
MTRISQKLLPLVIPTLIALLPLLILNFLGKIVLEREYERQLTNQQDEARQSLESLAGNWRFEDQMERISRQFLHKLDEMFTVPETSLNLPLSVRLKLRECFSHHFPDHQLWVFQYPDPDNPSKLQLIYSKTGKNVSQKSLCMAFHHLTSNYLSLPEMSSESRTAKKISENYFGEMVQPSTLAHLQMGVPTRIINQNRQCWLVWSLLVKNEKPYGGFILVVPDNFQTVRSGMEIGLGKAEPGQTKGYLRIHSGKVGDVLDPILQKSHLFRRWVRKFRSAKVFFRTLETNAEPSKGINLGKFRLFYRIIPDSPHLALVAFPELNLSKIKSKSIFYQVIQFFSLFSFSIILFVLGRGLMLNVWPEIPLLMRFTWFYALAVSVSLSLGVVGAFAYIQETKASLIRNLRQEIVSKLDSVDIGKESIQDRYKNAFHKLLKDPVFKDPLALEELNRGGNKNPEFLRLSTQYFQCATPSLTLSLFAIVDSQNNFVATFGNRINQNELEGIWNFFRSAMVSSLRERIANKGAPKMLGKNPLSDDDEILVKTYEGASNNPTSEMMEEYRDWFSFFVVGKNHVTKLHDFIFFNGIERFGVMIFWTTRDFERQVLLKVFEEFQKRQDSIFMAYRNTETGFEPIFNTSNSHDLMLRPLIEKLARSDSNYIQNDEENKVISFIRASRRLNGVVLAVQVKTDEIYRTIKTKSLWIGLFLLIGTISAISLGILTGNRVLTPVNQLKEALTKIKHGDLEVCLKIDRSDEFGKVGDSFDLMIDGLKKRKRFSTVISQKALETITKSHDMQAAQRVRRTQVVTLVSDIRNFTTICESQPVEIVINLLNKHFDEMAKVIKKFDGRVDKFIGDAIQAVFELDEKNNLSSIPEKALMAAIEMLLQLEKINAQRLADNLFSYSIGIGLSKGEVIIGMYGDEVSKRCDFSVLGSPMKNAAHLESLSKKVPWFPIVVDPNLAIDVDIRTRMIPLKGFEGEAMVFSEPVVLTEKI